MRKVNLQKLELKFFKDLSYLETADIKELETYEKIRELYFSYSFSFMKVVAIVDNFTIFKNNNYNPYLCLETNNFKIGEIVLSDGEEKIVKVDKEILKLKREYISGLPKIDTLENINEIDINKINELQKIQEKLDKEKLEQEERERLAEEKAEKERIEKELNKDKDYQNYFKNGIFKAFRLEIIKNKCILNENVEIKLLKNDFNKVVEYDKLNSIADNNHSYKKTDVVNMLIEKRIDFEINNNGNINTFEFTDKTQTANKIKVRKDKLNLVFTMLDNGKLSNDKIEIVSKLTQMKRSLLELKELKVGEDSNLKIPIKIDIVNDNLFKIEFLGKEKELDWNKCKEHFFFNNSRTIEWNWYLESIYKIGLDFGLNKTDVLKELKDISLIRGL